MAGALFYLLRTSLENVVRVRVARLRQPRYLAGLVLVILYVWSNFGRLANRAAAAGPATGLDGISEALLALPLLATLVLLGWVLRDDPPSMRFTEAEMAMLFPAPVGRRTLLHFRLVKSEFAILISSVVFTLISGRFFAAPVVTACRVFGTWLVLSTVSLHFLAASFTRERLRLGGVPRWLQNAVVLVGCGVVGAVTWQRWPGARGVAFDVEHADLLVARVNSLLMTQPLSSVLLPLRWLVRLKSSDVNVFVHALPGALLVLALHYVWVLRSVTAFEEGSLARAQKVAARKEAQRAPSVQQPEPFTLTAATPWWLAFVWKGLIEAGAMGRWRVLAGISAAVAVASVGVAAWSADLLEAVATFGLTAAGLVAFSGPFFSRRGVARLFERLDVVRALPLTGSQAVFGEVLAQAFATNWLVATLAIPSLLVGTEHLRAVAVVFVVLGPPVTMLLTLVHFAIALLLPAWSSAVAGAQRGVEAAGQRMLFLLLFVAILARAVVPCAPLVALLYLAGEALGAPADATIVVTGAACALVLSGELWVLIRALGARYERFDLSVEWPQVG